MPRPTAFPDPERIAVFQALFLGDLLCATPAIAALKRRFPGAEITLIGLPWARELADRLPSIDRFEEFPGYPGLPDRPVDEPEVSRFFERARQARYDLAIQLHGSGGITNEIVTAFGAAVTIGHGAGDDSGMSAVLPWSEDENEIRRWLRLVSLAGAEISDTRMVFPITDAERGRAAHLLRELPGGRGPVVGLHAGAKDPARRWPVDRFAELADILTIRHSARIALTGTEGERPLTSAIRGRMRTPVLDLAGTTDLGTLAEVISRLDLLVTNDTGASHVAAAVGTPSVVMYGPSRPVRWAPIDCDRHTVVDARAIAGSAIDPRDALHVLPVEPVLAACTLKIRGATELHRIDVDLRRSKEIA